MNTKWVGLLLLAALIFGLLISAAARQSDDDAESRRVVLGFMQARERVKVKASSPIAPARPQQQAAGKPADPKDNKKASSKPLPQPNNRPSQQQPSTGATDEELLGFGLTLFQRNQNGNAQRVDASKAFRSGDQARLLIEPHTEGYLYIFHTENDGAAEMIYPSPFLKGGSNDVQAHKAYETPSRGERQFQWFEFFDPPATERLYIVLSREPLPDAPTGSALKSLCSNVNPRCLWKVPTDRWKQITAAVTAPARVGFSRSFGQEETAEEGEAIARGFGLPPKAPAPSVIYLSQNPKVDFFVRRIDLIHR